MSKTKEISNDFRRRRVVGHIPMVFDGEGVEMVSNFRFLDTILTNELSWSSHVSGLVEKAAVIVLSEKTKESRVATRNIACFL